MNLLSTTNCSCYMYIMKNSEFIAEVISLSNPEFHIVSDTKIFTVSEQKEACRVKKVGQVPFLPFISSSSVLLQLSVEPCQTQRVKTKKSDGDREGDTSKAFFFSFF